MTYEPDSRTLALEAIAEMKTSQDDRIAKERLAIAIAIARIEVAKTPEQMMQAMDSVT